jgi:hypothetical protein
MVDIHRRLEIHNLRLLDRGGYRGTRLGEGRGPRRGWIREGGDKKEG